MQSSVQTQKLRSSTTTKKMKLHFEGNGKVEANSTKELLPCA
jgi:hypothetical protein